MTFRTHPWALLAVVAFAVTGCDASGSADSRGASPAVVPAAEAPFSPAEGGPSGRAAYDEARLRLLTETEVLRVALANYDTDHDGFPAAPEVSQDGAAVTADGVEIATLSSGTILVRYSVTNPPESEPVAGFCLERLAGTSGPVLAAAEWVSTAAAAPTFTIGAAAADVCSDPVTR